MVGGNAPRPLREMQNTLLECAKEAGEGEMTDRGNGSIYTRDRSRFYWLSYYAHGKEQREVARFVGKGKNAGKKIEATEENRKEAERALKQRVEKVITARNTGHQFIGPQQQRITVADLLDDLKRDYELRDCWNVKVDSNITPLREYFGPMRACDVTADSTRAFIEQLRSDDYSNATINRRTQLLGQAFKLAVINKKLAAVPFIPRLSEVGNERQGFFEAAEVETVIANLPEYLRDFTRFGFLTGWRKGSIQKLRWCDVTDSVIYLRAMNAKARKPESVPLEGDLAGLIERRRAAAAFEDKEKQAHVSAYVFHVQGQPIGEFRKSWAKACCAAGVGQMVGAKYIGRIFHDLRRSAARDMVLAGNDPIAVMKITGHHTMAMFTRYCIINEEPKRNVLASTQAYRAASTSRKVLRMAATR